MSTFLRQNMYIYMCVCDTCVSRLISGPNAHRGLSVDQMSAEIYRVRCDIFVRFRTSPGLNVMINTSTHFCPPWCKSVGNDGGDLEYIVQSDLGLTRLRYSQNKWAQCLKGLLKSVNLQLNTWEKLKQILTDPNNLQYDNGSRYVSTFITLMPEQKSSHYAQRIFNIFFVSFWLSVKILPTLVHKGSFNTWHSNG